MRKPKRSDLLLSLVSGTALLSVAINACAQQEKQLDQVVADTLTFDTRKSVDQEQLGVVVEHKLDRSNTLNACLYAGTR